jgi:hypothetical protein
VTRTASRRVPSRTSPRRSNGATSRAGLPDSVGTRRRPVGIVEQHVHELRVAGVVIEHRHEHVAGVASDHDVLSLREEPQPVGGEVTLDETAVTLGLDQFEHRFDRAHEAGVDPRGEVADRHLKGAGPEHEGSEDPLRPRGPSLVGSRDEDVVITGHEPVPAGAVEMMVAVLAGAFRCPVSGRLGGQRRRGERRL